jgi:hypothetical protein
VIPDPLESILDETFINLNDFNIISDTSEWLRLILSLGDLSHDPRLLPILLS